MHFKETAHVKLHDARLQANLAKLKGKFVERARTSLSEVDDFEGTREAGRAIRDRALEDLDVWLELFERNATARGAKVLFARERRPTSTRWCSTIAARHGVTKIVKSKSMVSRGVRARPRDRGRRLQVVETDLGEYILQINDYEPPSHIVGPVLHKSKDEVADLFDKAHGTPRKTGVEELCLEARGRSCASTTSPRTWASPAATSSSPRPGPSFSSPTRATARLTTTLPQGARRDLGYREDRADARGRCDADAPADAVGDRAVDIELRRRLTGPKGRANTTAPSTCTSSSSTAGAPACSAATCARRCAASAAARA